MTGQSTRILGLDLGTKRIGVAIADIQTKVATGFGVIEYKGKWDFLAKLREIVHGEDIGLIVIGLPKNMDGSEGDPARKTRDMAALIESDLKVDIKLVDERLTTVQATKALHAGDGKIGKSKDKIDMMSAILILQGYLEGLSS